MNIRDLGEFGLIERIRQHMQSPSADVVVGIGDDVAVLRTATQRYLLATCDAQVEDVHFLRDKTPPRSLGSKAININVSDIAAMGGSPKWALLSLAVPPDLAVDFVDTFMQGMWDSLDRFEIVLVGGNITKCESALIIDVTLLGEAEADALITRNGARENDAILVTGDLGGARAGLEKVLKPELPASREDVERALKRYFEPQARLAAGRFLARTGKVHAMLDVSDGLVSDLGHLCKASGVGAEIWLEALPVAPSTKNIAQCAGTDWLDWVLAGGEDYELLFTAAPGDARYLMDGLRCEADIPCAIIGRVLPKGTGMYLCCPNGEYRDLEGKFKGWDHLTE